MDPIGGATSLITLIDVVVKTFRLIKSLTLSYQNAPEEIQSLRHRIDGLTSNLLLLRHVQITVSADRNALDFDSAEFDPLKRSLSVTSAIFAEILSFLEKNTLREGRSRRIKWALRDASKVKAWEARVQRHGELLQTTLLLLNR